MKNMKMKQKHFNIIKEGIAEIPRETAFAHYNKLLLDERVKDINKRFRNDMFFAFRQKSKIIHELYDYLNDDNIDTALRKIMRELNYHV